MSSADLHLRIKKQTCRAIVRDHRADGLLELVETVELSVRGAHLQFN